jgi:hypothetical protein
MQPKRVHNSDEDLLGAMIDPLIWVYLFFGKEWCVREGYRRKKVKVVLGLRLSLCREEEKIVIKFSG